MAAPAAASAAAAHGTPSAQRGTAVRSVDSRIAEAWGSSAVVPAAKGSAAVVADEAARAVTAIIVRAAEPRDAAALAALDAACAVDGSSGWSEGIYRTDLQPGSSNLILVAELPCTADPGPQRSPPTDMVPAAAPTDLASGPGLGTDGHADTDAASSSPAADTAAQPTALLTLPSDTEAGEPAMYAATARATAAASAEATTRAGGGTAADAASPPPPPLLALAAGLEAGGEVSLTNLAVAPAARGAGLGWRMAEELLRRLGAECFPSVLEVRADNRTAQALYGRLGFRTAGVRRRYNADGSDSLVMVRPPAPLPLISAP